MKNTSLQTCSLAGNLITKIPSKLAVSFSLITGRQSVSEKCEWVLALSDHIS